jgi:hypothetical protein
MKCKIAVYEAIPAFSRKISCIFAFHPEAAAPPTAAASGKPFSRTEKNLLDAGCCSTDIIEESIFLEIEIGSGGRTRYLMKLKQWSLAALVFCLSFTLFGGTAFGASARYAVVTEAVGNVTVMKAGGALEIPVFTDMELREGDRLKVGKGGSLTLKFAGSEHEIVLGENWQGTLSRLRENDKGGTDTAIKTWAGSMYSHVQKLTDTGSTFKVETPTSEANVRGTHFLVVIDPYTGLPKMIVNAGRVEANNENTGSVSLLPGQQVEMYPGGDPFIGVEYIDPEDLTVYVDTEVIEKLLKKKALIDAENDELLKGLANLDDNSILNLTDEKVFARYKTNVENMLAHILREAAESGKLDESTLVEILETVKQSIEDVNRNYDLEQDLPEIDRSAGIDEEEEARRRQMRDEAQQKMEQRQRQTDQKREEVRNNNPEKMEAIQQQKEQQREATEEAKRRSEEELLSKLNEEQRKAMEEKRRKREEQDNLASPSAPVPEIPNEPDLPSPSVPVGPLPTSTSIELSEHSIVYGQTFTITADVKMPNSMAVPNGGKVDFKIGASVIGSGTIADGKAALTVDEGKWASPEMAGIGIGLHEVSAVYAGVAQQYGSSTSNAAALTIAEADTIVALSVTPDPPNPGDILEIEVSVAAKPPGGGEPSGMITLYRLLDDEWQPVAEPIRLEPGMQSVTFQDTFLRDTGVNEMQYKAEFVSDNGKHNNGVSEVKEVTIQPTWPVVQVNKVLQDESQVFEIQIDLANFTVTNAVYGAEFRFRHSTDFSIVSDQIPYNTDKFDSEHLNMFGTAEELIDDHLVFKTIFRLQVNEPHPGVEFSSLQNMAKIRFQLDPEAAISVEDAIVELVYWQFTGKDGEPIEVEIQHGEDIIVNLSE